jgi:hypothetical protein
MSATQDEDYRAWAAAAEHERAGSSRIYDERRVALALKISREFLMVDARLAKRRCANHAVERSADPGDLSSISSRFPEPVCDHPSPF